MATRLLPPGYQQLDANGAPVSGAKLYTYDAGTSTPKATYSDAGLTVANANPVVADSAGRFGPIFATTGDYALTMKTSADVTLWTADPVSGATGAEASPGAGVRNLLTDGDFASVLTLTAVATDGGYIADNWYALNQSNNTTAALQTLQQDGIPNNLRVTQANATPQRYGVAQVIPAADSYRARGATVTLSGKIRHSITAPIRYAVLAWTGTADSVTKDVVSDWTSSNYTASNFFLSSDVSVVGVGVITPTANTWTDITALSGSVTSSANNLIVFFWTEGATVQNATLDVTQVQLEVAASATAYEFLPDWLASQVNGWRLIANQEGISVSAIDFTLPSGFRAFKITITDMAIGTDNTQIGLRTSVDGGASFSSGASDYNFRQLWNSTSSAVSTSTGDTSLIPLSVTMDGSTLLIGEYIFFVGSASVAASLVGHSTYVDDGGGSAYGGIGLFGGRRNATGAVNAIRIFPSGGVLSGVVSLVGIR